jgi:hypothetical protein
MGKVNSTGDILSWLRDRGSTTQAEEPRLTSFEGWQEVDFRLLDPSTLKNAKYGYYKGAVPWIVSNDDAFAGVSRLPSSFVDCVVTSPPYYWQRDYEVEGQTGQEESVVEYVQALVAVFREVRRALKSTGTACVVLGDTYYSGRGQPRGGDRKQIWRGVARKKYRAVDRLASAMQRNPFSAYRTESPSHCNPTAGY